MCVCRETLFCLLVFTQGSIFCASYDTDVARDQFLQLVGEGCSVISLKFLLKYGILLYRDCAFEYL